MFLLHVSILLYRLVYGTEALGLEEYLGDGGVDSSQSRGAYLSLVYLRYLRIRELQVKGAVLMVINKGMLNCVLKQLLS